MDMNKIEVFDPPMCCSTGVCGPSVDPTLARFSSDLHWLAGARLRDREARRAVRHVVVIERRRGAQRRANRVRAARDRFTGRPAGNFQEVEGTLQRDHGGAIFIRLHVAAGQEDCWRCYE